MKINTKSSKEPSCCLKALALKSSIKRTRVPAKKKIKVEFVNAPSRALLKKLSVPSAGCWLTSNKIKLMKRHKIL